MSAAEARVGKENSHLYCGICEAACGLVATVGDDDTVTLRPDPTHPNSHGFACSKGIAFPAVREDPDRILHPMRRQPDGTFTAVGWDEALDDIGRRLRAVVAEHGRESIGLYLGNAGAFNYSAFLWVFGFAAALKTKHFYTAASIDINNYWVVGESVYGHNLVNPVPDVDRTDFFLCLGANPVVSHGSMLNVGHIRTSLLRIPERGGRVVIVDPRRSETAQLFEHQPILPGADPWLLAAMLHVILRERLEDTETLASTRGGRDALWAVVGGVDLERAAAETAIPAATIEMLARDFAAAPAACAYGRCGASLGPFSTLTKFLIDAINIATGNFDRAGGMVFGIPALDTEQFTKLFRLNGYDRWRTRVDGHPEVLGTSPAATMATEMLTPGKGQLRALINCFGNPAMSIPNSGEVERGLASLDLLVCVDPYLTDTSRLADYILPPALWLEREGMPIFTQPHSNVPYAQWVSPTVPPRGQAREDWWIVDQIAKRIGLAPSPAPGAQLAAKLGIRLKPSFVADAFMRIGPHGDLFGLRRRGISRKKLLRHPGGVKLADRLPTGVARHRLHHKDRRVHLDDSRFVREMGRMAARVVHDVDAYPLRLFSIRELRSHNTWMLNVPKLMAGDRVQRLRIHPADAAVRGIDTGDHVVVTSPQGAITVEAQVTDDIIRGAIGLPHGWGHRGGWRRATAAGGANYNILTPDAPDAVDVLSGNAVYNGVSVEVTRAVVTATVGAEREL